LGGLKALHDHANGRQKLPEIRWSYEPADAADNQAVTLRVSPGAEGAKVFLWTASQETRDFRTAKWTSTAVELNGEGDALVQLDPPATGYRAAFAEVVYSNGLLPLQLSTTIRVLRAAE